MSDNSKAIKVMIAAKSEAMLLKVKSFMQEKALAVLNTEALATAGHAERVAYAKTVLAGTANVAEMSIAVCVNPSISATIDAGNIPPDGDLQYAVYDNFDAFAGYEKQRA